MTTEHLLLVKSLVVLQKYGMLVKWLLRVPRKTSHCYPRIWLQKFILLLLGGRSHHQGLICIGTKYVLVVLYKSLWSSQLFIHTSFPEPPTFIVLYPNLTKNLKIRFIILDYFRIMSKAFAFAVLALVAVSTAPSSNAADVFTDGFATV